MNIVLFLIGASVGSFINMLVYRTAIKYGISKRKNITLGNRSVCDYCQHQLNWYENIPIVSWFYLKGRTLCCQKNLDFTYPLVEIFTGIMFVLAKNFGIGAYIIVSCLIFSAVFDFKYMILPDFSTVIMTITALLIVANTKMAHLSTSLVVGLASGVFLGGLHLLTKGKGMGMGDVKMAPFMGIILGFPKIVLAYYIAFIVGSVVSIIMMMIKRLKIKSKIAFGPFLILGTIVSWWYGEKIIYYLINQWF